MKEWTDEEKAIWLLENGDPGFEPFWEYTDNNFCLEPWMVAKIREKMPPWVDVQKFVDAFNAEWAQ